MYASITLTCVCKVGCYCSKTFENTEGEIKNGQSRRKTQTQYILDTTIGKQTQIT